MTAPNAPVNAISSALKATGAVVLRNHDLHEALASGGDVDALVADLDQAERILAQWLGTPRICVERSYVRSIYYDWGHVDLIRDLQWRGAVYLRTDEVIAHALTKGAGPAQPRLAHEALISWFSSLLWGGFFKERYRDVIIGAASTEPEEFQRILRQAVGRRWAERLVMAAAAGTPEQSTVWVSRLRRALWRRAGRRDPVGTLRRTADFARREIELRLRPPLPWVAVLGPDGSGKSSVLAEFDRSFPRTLGAVHRYHWRPARIDPGRREDTAPVTDPHGSPPRGFLISTLKLGWLVLDWWLGYWTRIVHQRAKQGLVVFDRHYLDLLVDPRRYRYGGSLRLARLIARLIPRPDVVVILDAEPDVLLSRKQEVSTGEVTRQRDEYLHLASRTPGARVVDATLPVSEIAATLTSEILDWLATYRHPSLRAINRAGGTLPRSAARAGQPSR